MTAPIGDRPAAADRRKELQPLFGRLASGDRSALEPIYDLAADKLYGLALWRTGSPADADDVLQETFVRLMKQTERLADIRDPFAFLATLAHRAAVDHVRRRRRMREATPIEDCSFLAAPDEEPERRVDAERASRLLAELPAAQREAVYLHHFADCTFAAIAEVTGVPTFTAASRYRLGMKKLRRKLEVTP